MKRGFTLVELSIVLVVIGLLIGGILVAQSMIGTAMIQQTIRQMQQYTIITQNFQTQYNCLPGDCSKNMGLVNWFSGYYGFNFPNYNTGDGDGLINVGNIYGVGVFTQEAFNYWAYLEQLNLIPPITTRITGNYNQFICAAGINSPTAPIITKKSGGSVTLGGGWWVFGLSSNATGHYAPPGMSGNVFFLGFGNTGSDNNASVMRNIDAQAIDAKIDDGLPLTGNIQAVGSILDGAYYDLVPPTNYKSANCLNTATTPNQYKLAGLNGFQECGLVIKADF